MRNLDTNNHSVFCMNYHLVMVTKYRKKVISKEISSRLKDIFINIQSNHNITLVEWNHDKDHVHILFKAHPNSHLSKFINAYKSTSSRLIKKDFTSTREHSWKEQFWSSGFCLITTGGVSNDIIQEYIQNQGK